MRRSASSLWRRISGVSKRRTPARPSALRSLKLEQFEQRLAMDVAAAADGDPFEVRLSIYVDSEKVTIPANIGVATGGAFLSQVHTTANTGVLKIAPIGSEELEDVTLGDFFETWRTNAGQAGNNANATFDTTELMGNDVDTTSNIQMFVNGKIVTSFDDYVLKAGDEIVLAYGENPVVALNTNFGSIVIELYEEETPGTVENFLKYVNDGDYLNSFFHRLDDDFVLQGGGFKTNSTTFTNVSQFSNVPTDDQIENEPGISNLRATIAMAKLGNNPDSATSQFFINLSDDNKFLDEERNNAFTVFGQVLDMTTVDEINEFEIKDAGNAPYEELPLGPNNQLVVIQTIEGQGEITGFRFNDTDSDGVKDTGENGVAGAVMWIDLDKDGVQDSNEPTATTDSTGAYRFQIAPGQYSVRAVPVTGKKITKTDAADGLDVTVKIGKTESAINFGQADFAAPTSVDLVNASDTGVSNSDNITKLNNASSTATLQFLVSGVTSGATVKLFAGGVEIGSGTATGTTITITTNGTASIADGTHNITAQQFVTGGQSAASTALSVTVDTALPAAITNTAPTTAEINTLYTFDPTSVDEAKPGFTYSLVDAPTGMTINATTGVINWTPTTAQAVPQLFEIRLTDAAGNFVSQTVDLNVHGVFPADPDNYTIAEDGTLTVTAANGVLQNDGEDGDTLTAELVEGPENGTLTLNADGSFTYKPNANFVGTDEFTYRAKKGSDNSNVARVKITVTNTDDPVVPKPDTYTATEDTTLTVSAANGVLKNDENPDDDDVTVAVVTTTTNGTLTLNADGSFTYVPKANFNGSDTFTYRVINGSTQSDPVTVTINVTAVNDVPTGVADTYTVAEDQVLDVTAANGVLKNDTDIDSTNLTVTVVTTTTNGTLTLNANGSFKYTPKANFNGTDTFTYRISDGTGNSANVTVTITVTAVDDDGEVHDPLITKSYQMYLGRAAETSGRDFYRQQLLSGKMTPFSMAYAIQHSPEYQGKVVKQMYTTLLGRSASDSEVATQRAFLNGGGSMDELRANLIASPEYFAAANNSNSSFLSSLYADVLGRSLDSNGSAVWLNALTHGDSRGSVALQIIQGEEASRKLITDAYDSYFDRSAADSEITFHLKSLRATQREETLNAFFAASAEFLKD